MQKVKSAEADCKLNVHSPTVARAPRISSASSIHHGCIHNLYFELVICDQFSRGMTVIPRLKLWVACIWVVFYFNWIQRRNNNCRSFLPFSFKPFSLCLTYKPCITLCLRRRVAFSKRTWSTVLKDDNHWALPLIGFYNLFPRVQLPQRLCCFITASSLCSCALHLSALNSSSSSTYDCLFPWLNTPPHGAPAVSVDTKNPSVSVSLTPCTFFNSTSDFLSSISLPLCHLSLTPSLYVLPPSLSLSPSRGGSGKLWRVQSPGRGSEEHWGWQLLVHEQTAGRHPGKPVWCLLSKQEAHMRFNKLGASVHIA